MIPIPRGAGSTKAAREGARLAGATFVVLTGQECQSFNEITLERARTGWARGPHPMVFDHRVVEHLEDKVDQLTGEVARLEIERGKLRRWIRESVRSYCDLHDDREVVKRQLVEARKVIAELRRCPDCQGTGVEEASNANEPVVCVACCGTGGRR